MMKSILNERASVMMQVRKGGIGVEIGVHEGRFSQTILKIAQPKKLYLIDPWVYHADKDESLYGGPAMSQAKMNQRHDMVCRRLMAPIASGRVEILRMESQSALAQVADGSLDFAYIDGDHTYAAVKADLQGWLIKLRPEGLLIADDYRDASWWGDAVIRACHEFLVSAPVVIDCKLGSQIAFRKL